MSAFANGPIAPRTSPEHRLKELDITLPPAPKPFGAYAEAVQTGNLLFLSGMLPVVGRVGGALSAEDGRKAAEIACLSALSAAKTHIGSLDIITGVVKLGITGVVKLGVFIAADGNFRDHPKVADGASELLVNVFGRGCPRAASFSPAPACSSACQPRSSSFLKLRLRQTRKCFATHGGHDELSTRVAGHFDRKVLWRGGAFPSCQ
jgi:enamine deaminase RidA (YjgF/YER057c/UK114 family)